MKYSHFILVILQGFWGQNPKNKKGNVKGVGWVHGLDEQSIWIGIDHGKLLVWILNSYCFWNHDDVNWDCPKRRILGRRKGIFRHSFGKSRKNCKYFVVKNHKFCFGYITKFICSFYFIFNKTWNFVVIMIWFSVK